jgi:hypothetical protein
VALRHQLSLVLPLSGTDGDRQEKPVNSGLYLECARPGVPNDAANHRTSTRRHTAASSQPRQRSHRAGGRTSGNVGGRSFRASKMSIPYHSPRTSSSRSVGRMNTRLYREFFEILGVCSVRQFLASLSNHRRSSVVLPQLSDVSFTPCIYSCRRSK